MIRRGWSDAMIRSSSAPERAGSDHKRLEFALVFQLAETQPVGESVRVVVFDAMRSALAVMSRPVADCEGCPALAGVRNLALDDLSPVVQTHIAISVAWATDSPRRRSRSGIHEPVEAVVRPPTGPGATGQTAGMQRISRRLRPPADRTGGHKRWRTYRRHAGSMQGVADDR